MLPALSKHFEISPYSFPAVIFDLDGVVTRTARVHARAWEELFNEYLRERSRRTGEAFKYFDVKSDYRQHVDGKLRYDGVRGFLESRGIQLPFGSPEDSPECETICGLGNRKNRIFMEELDKHGVEVFDSTISLIRGLRRRSVKTAIVSSSKNCVPVLRAAGALDLFDTKVDGLDAEQLKLHGKPAPDIFLEAARQLGVKPACAIVVEDAIAGVQAGEAGGFGCVIGVNRLNQAEALLQNGADLVVDDLAEVDIRSETPVESNAKQLPSALDHLSAIKKMAARKRLVVFLDYDGTLTPIVSRPEDAVLREDMRSAVRALASRYTVAIVSGRALKDVRSLVGLNGIFYSGSHGFEIEGPSGLSLAYQEGVSFLPLLEEVERELREKVAGIAGAQIEHKKYSIAVHYRNVSPGDEPAVKQAVDEIIKQHRELRVSSGKKVWDIQPAIDWNKGKALLWVLNALELNSCTALPLFIGDDTTDEDAFRAIYDRGVAIIVREEPRPTVAQFALDGTEQVRRFLSALADQGGSEW